MTNNDKTLEEIVSAWSEGTGAAVGGLVGSLVGGPVGTVCGGYLGVAVSRTLIEFSNRALSQREEMRVGTTAIAALEKIQSRLKYGEAPRNDEFFTLGHDGRSEAEEIFEATLFKAKIEAEERKLPYLSNAFANIAFRKDISPPAAHFLLKLAEELTYRQICFLALVQSLGSLDVENLRRGAHSVPDLDTLRREEMSLHDKDLGTMGLMGGDGPWTDQLTDLGNVLAEVLGLNEFPGDELRALEEVIRSCCLPSS